MKIFSWLIIGATCAFLVSCEKPQSDADRKAQVEQEVQARLDAEHQTQEQQRLAQQQADLDAREKALAAKEAAGAPEEATAAPRVVARERAPSSDERAPQSYDTFYRKLEPYGAWRESADYGFVWQPRAVQESRGWRPYTDGRWAYTDAGWTWISDEPFGWATYHYGRWTRLRDIGWVWVPGDEWAPAWVSWRTSDKHVGWAPLPPEARFDRGKGIHKWADNYYDIDAGEYVFVPNEEIGDENIQRAVIPEDRNVTIVSETTNVTNITYNNTTIMNEGPNFDALRAHSRRPVERLRLQREYNVDRENQRAVVSGETLQVVTPFFTARVTEKPRTSAPMIQRGTAAHAEPVGDRAEFDRARQKMRSEATPPPDAPPKKFERPLVAQGTTAPVASATPAATVATTPRPQPMVASTPVPSATVRPTFTPRATPSATVIPSQTATPIPPPRQIPTVAAPRATPALPAATPAEDPNRAALKLEEQRKRQEAREKVLQMERIPRSAPTPTVENPAVTPNSVPRQVATPQPTARPLPADMTEGTPSGIELAPTPKPAPKRPPRALPPNSSPTPTPAR